MHDKLFLRRCVTGELLQESLYFLLNYKIPSLGMNSNFASSHVKD